MTTDLRDLVQLLKTQQERIFEVLEFDERPILRPPVSSELLARLENWWSDKGGILPDSYREFLMICDGIENFCVSYSIFGACDLLSSSYPSLLRQVIEGGIGYTYSMDIPPILIGYDEETTTRVFFDLFHQSLRDNEPVVLEGDPGDMSLHESFKAFLACRSQANELTISRLLEMRSERTKPE